MSIIFEDVTYIYNKNTPMEKTALKGISLSIAKGEFVAVLGDTGSGKSTLLQLIGGLFKPASGNILSHGSVGMVFQFPERQFFEETVYGDLSFPLRRAGVSEADIESRIRGALSDVDIDFHPYRNRSPLELSSGEKRRVAIAAILVLRPEIIVLDEPLAVLDGKGKREILKELKRLQIETGKTVIMATQDWEAVSKICDRVLFLEDGTLAGDKRAGQFEERVSEASAMQYLRNALKARAIDLGNGVFDAELAFMRINTFAEKKIDTTG